MRVLHVIPGLASRTGGPAVSVVESALAVERLGVSTTIATTDLGGPAHARGHARVAPSDLPEGASELDVRMFPAVFPRRLARAPRLAAWLRAEGGSYDVVHVHSLFLLPQLYAGRAAANAGVPYVVAPRGALLPYLRARGRLQKEVAERLWQRAMLERAAALHATTDAEAALLRKLFPLVPCFAVPNGIRWAELDALPSGDAFRRRHLAGAGGPVVLSLGRIAPSKGLDLLVGAFVKVAAALPDARLVIAGPDDARLVPRLAALARERRVDDRVIFTGMLRGQEKREALAAADVWAMPSHSEGFGLALAEAMAAGLPVVVTPAVALAEQIVEADAGIVSARDEDAFADAILRVLRDATLRAALSGRARRFARRFDWEVVGEQLVAMYEQIARTRGAVDAVPAERAVAG